MEPQRTTAMEMAGPPGWQPRQLVDAALNQELAEFTQQTRAPLYVLLESRVLTAAARAQLVARACVYPERKLDETSYVTEIAGLGSPLAVDPSFAAPSQRTATDLVAHLAARDVLIVPICARERERRVISLGRSIGTDLPIKHASVSKLHAVLNYDDEGRLFIREAGSKNGTFVNGRRQEAVAELFVGDCLMVGRVRGYVVDPCMLWCVLRGAARLDPPR